MRVLVCGGRDYRDVGVVFRELSAIHRATPISAVIEGMLIRLAHTPTRAR